MRPTLLAVVMVAACGGSGSQAADAPAGDDAPLADAGDPLTDALDAAPDAFSCGTLPAAPANVFVDIAATGDSIGTAACPFHAIAEALALAPPDAANPRVVHVAAGAYAQAALVVVPANLTLAGADAATVTITGGGTCLLAAATCTVSVTRGATLRAVTVTNTTGNAVEVGGGAGTATVDHVIARDSLRAGFLVRGDTLLDHVEARDNKQDGVNAKSASVVSTDSAFVNNQDDGLDIDQAATLVLTGGIVHNNDGAGIRLHNGTSFTPLDHAITGADIQQNLGFGIDCSSNASLKLRGTTMFQNEIGLFVLVGANALDLGTAADPGNNVFAGATPVNGNARAGLCFENSAAAATQLVEGNSWRVCPPPQRKIPGPFCRSNNTYSDIAFASAAATGPVIPPAACTVGP